MTESNCACRSCGQPRLATVLDLGETPLANSLLNREQLQQAEQRYPLAVAVCKNCSLAQLTQTVAPEEMFSHYLYFSSVSDAMLRHARSAAEHIIAARRLDGSSLVVEIASNDGYLLRNFVAAGVPVLGIDPAANIAKVANERGIRTLCEFFSQDLAERLAAEGQHADVIMANNVMAHVPAINDVVAGIGRLLKPDGVFLMETPYVRELVERIEFDTIYHEHVFYYSLTALRHLFARHALILHDVERLPIHGGSLRVSFVPERATLAGAATPAVQAMLEDERRLGIDGVGFYRELAPRVEHLRRTLTAMLHDLKAQGCRVAAYGASAKGSTLLNSFGLGADVLEYVVDRSPAKQGRFTPGTHLPIVSPDVLTTRRPDYLLLLTWNFADEILAQQEAYRRAGGRFIIPLPEPRIV